MEAREVFAQSVTAGSLRAEFASCGAFGLSGRIKNWLRRLRKPAPSEYALAERAARAAEGKKS